jgi:hypothetical protein
MSGFGLGLNFRTFWAKDYSGTHECKEKCTQNFGGENLKEQNQLEDLGVCESTKFN